MTGLSSKASPRLGHTGITWPFTPAGALRAMHDVAEVGYSGIELFGFVIDVYPGGVDGVRDDLQRHGLDLGGAYCSFSLVDPRKHDDDVDAALRWATAVSDLGSQIVVVGPDQKTHDRYEAEDYARITRSLDEIGRICEDVGVAACFHPHTGTPVETHEQIARVMDAVDPALVGFAPDTGQLAKGGADPVEVVRTYRELIHHIHLKDYVGGASDVEWEGLGHDRTGYLDYLPLGQGVVDLAGVLSNLRHDYDGWLMAELDATPVEPQPPRDAAAASLRCLQELTRVVQTEGTA